MPETLRDYASRVFGLQPHCPQPPAPVQLPLPQPGTVCALVHCAIGPFDRELLPSLGIDVYDHPFDPALGCTTIETPSVPRRSRRIQYMGSGTTTSA